ncbi:conserved hypothetical protein [Lacticaseibacillus rhamnosus ATCC 8530]|nr:conserved hypothetical protein [Lacticaseibacillus rhamnosus ATCC 8530]
MLPPQKSTQKVKTNILVTDVLQSRERHSLIYQPVWAFVIVFTFF